MTTPAARIDDAQRADKPRSDAAVPPPWPSGESPDDPRPTPITLGNLRHWARLTLRSERTTYRRLGRSPRRGPRPMLDSILPGLDRPLFILGAARSGTTFLGEAIGHIPEISYHHEPAATKAAGRYVYEGEWGFTRGSWFYRQVYRWLLRIELDGGLRFAEKTPTNGLVVPFLDRAFPDAQFVHIVRDGRDAASSHLKKPWLLEASRGSTEREPGGYLFGPYAPFWVEPERRAEFESTSDVHRMIWAWRRHVQAAIDDATALGPDRYLELRYEHLMAEPGQTGERILDFLGIERPASRSQLHEALERVQPGTVGNWQTELTSEDLAVIEADSGELLRRLGYLASGTG